MRPVQFTPIGSELALLWSDGREDYIPMETLRKQCPCANCMGEQDIMGNVHRPPQKPYGPGAFTWIEATPVGGYAFQPRWGDGHNTGIYSWEYLRHLADRLRQASPEVS